VLFAARHVDPATSDATPEPSPLAHITVLLVDDDPDIRTLTRTFLEHSGFRVLSSGDAERAAQIFLSTPRVDLLIADQNMPGRSGMELAFQLKNLQPELPVLMISAGTIESAPKSLFTQPGWTFLPKPFSLPALLDTVHTVLQTGEPQERGAGKPQDHGRTASA
jgi:two-component system, chemotaxis family, chemotaxis protein CheY